MDLVSVIIPVYNAASYLERCVDSVINQNYPNIEIVLVNDGSTDDSLPICQKYAENYNNILVINQHNTGASIARRNGIKASKGKYLIFVDSDDYVSNSYVSSLYSAIVDNNAEISICPFKRVNPGDKVEAIGSIAASRVIQKEELLRRFFKYEFWGFWGGLYARQLFDNLSFPTATINEDYYVKAQMFAHVAGVGYVEDALYYYEQHPGSLSKQPLTLRALGEFDNALATWEFISENMPEYSGQALAIASEAACKWLGALNRKGNLSEGYLMYYEQIRKFVHKNFIYIMTNPHLLWKLKFILLRNILCAVH